MNRIIKYGLVIITYLSINFVYSQIPECLIENDTLYILYSGGDFQTKDSIQSPSKLQGRIVSYYFYPNGKTATGDGLYFYRHDYMSYEDYEAGKKTEEKVEKKSFLRKNKRKLIDHDFLLSYGVGGFISEAGYNRKVYYVVDTTEYKRKVVLRRMYMMAQLQEE